MADADWDKIADETGLRKYLEGAVSAAPAYDSKGKELRLVRRVYWDKREGVWGVYDGGVGVAGWALPYPLDVSKATVKEVEDDTNDVVSE